ncbi:hypothetical protein OKW29_008073 [Paraburkholderia sp. CI3]
MTWSPEQGPKRFPPRSRELMLATRSHVDVRISGVHMALTRVHERRKSYCCAHGLRLTVQHLRCLSHAGCEPARLTEWKAP